MPTADLLRLAEILDQAGYAYLEVSGGGAFDAAVRRGVESPWERIRAIRARTKTPLVLAVRGSFLVGSRPVGDDLVRRFMASAAESGIDAFRLHDPLNDAENLAGRRQGRDRRRAASSTPACCTARPATTRSPRRRRSCPRSAPPASCSTTRPGSCSRTAPAS